MPRTPDRTPGPADEEGIILEDTVSPTQVGELRYTGGSFLLQDSAGVFNPRSGGSGLTESQHKTLRQLIHFVDDGPAEGFFSGTYRETVGGVFPTSVTWYEDNTKAEKIVELTITRNANKTPSVETWKMYDTDGTTILSTITDTIVYSGVNETSRTRAIT